MCELDIEISAGKRWIGGILVGCALLDQTSGLIRRANDDVFMTVMLTLYDLDQEETQWRPQQERPWPRQFRPLLELLAVCSKGQGH